MLLTATASANIATSTFNGNTAPNNGGGIHSRGTLTIANATLSGNTARNGGGGLFVGGGSATLNNVTLADNHSDVAGVALSNAGGSLLLRNTIVASAVPSGSCAGRISSLGYNLDSGQTCGLSAQGDIVGTNPMLAPLASSGGPTLTHALQSGSPAIDAGTPPGSSGCEATDQRGQPRPTDGNGDGIARCDIGAVEAPTVSAPAPIPVSANQPVPLPASAAVSGTPTSGIAVPTSLVPPVVLTTAPARVATAIAIVVPVVGASPAEGSAVDITWVLTTEQVEAFSVDDEPLEAVEAGEWLTLLLEQDGWLLVASDPSSPFWIAYDDRIEIYGG